MEYETVSLCIVTYNEEKYIGDLLNDILNNNYPLNFIELIIVDGYSSDNTIHVIEDFKTKYLDKFKNIVFYMNPKKIQASGWNIALMHTTGDIIIRIDAHSHITNNFIVNNVLNLQSGEFVSGGPRPCLIKENDKFHKMLLQTENSLFGSSISKGRHSETKEYVKSFFHAAYRKEVFKRVGGFNENLLRTEDNELHYRIRKEGFKFAMDPSIVSYQYARNDIFKMIKQKYGNGYWVGLTLGVCPGCISLFHLTPFAFLCAIIFFSILSAFGFHLFIISLFILYFIFGILSTIISCKNDGYNSYCLLMPFMFLMLHLSYGIGTLIGLIKMPFLRKKLIKCDKIREVKIKFNQE